MVAPVAIGDKIMATLKAPATGAEAVDRVDGGFRCARTGEIIPDIDGVPSLFGTAAGDGEDVTSRVKDFYEENPFPNYDGVEEFGNLANKGFQNSFSAALLETIGFNKLVLECGCGTGQLTHFLQLNNNHTLGVDLSLSSLKLALEHKRRNGLTRASFVHMNIFDLAVKDAAFDVVIAQGVLHHTFDARRAFAEVVRKVKPGGIVVVGLYNRYARVPSWMRSKLVGMVGPNIDFIVRTRIHDAAKARIWINDQYYNPHETWHSIGEVLDWFGENGIEYLNCRPPVLGTSGEHTTALDEKTDPGNGYQRLVTQLSWLFSISREGALFDLIGRRRS